MAKKFVKRTDANNETLYFYTHSDVVDVGEGNNVTSLTNALNNKTNETDVERIINDTSVRYDESQVLGSSEKTQALQNLGLNGVDETPEDNSLNMVRSGGIKSAIDGVIDDFINRGFIYKGIAPLVAPTTSNKTFYIAKSGSYTGYVGVNGGVGDSGNFTLNGIAVLTYDTEMSSGAWAKNELFGIDDEPTPNSDNLVKSGGVFDNTVITKEQLSSPNKERMFNGRQNIEALHVSSEVYNALYMQVRLFDWFLCNADIVEDILVTTTAECMVGYYTVSKGDSIVIRTNQDGAGNNSHIRLYFTSQKPALGSDFTNKLVVDRNISDGDDVNIEYTAPSDGYLVVRKYYRTSINYECFVHCDFSDTLNYRKQDIVRIPALYKIGIDCIDSSETFGQAIKTISTGNYGCSDFINVYGAKYLQISARRIYSFAMKNGDIGSVFYDENKNPLCSAFICEFNGVTNNRYSFINVPPQAHYIRITSHIEADSHSNYFFDNAVSVLKDSVSECIPTKDKLQDLDGTLMSMANIYDYGIINKTIVPTASETYNAYYRSTLNSNMGYNSKRLTYFPEVIVAGKGNLTIRYTGLNQINVIQLKYIPLGTDVIDSFVSSDVLDYTSCVVNTDPSFTGEATIELKDGCRRLAFVFGATENTTKNPLDILNNITEIVVPVVDYSTLRDNDENTNGINSIIKQSSFVVSSPTTPSLNLLHFSDIHGDQNAADHINEIYRNYGSIINDILCTGDSALYYAEGNAEYPEGVDWWKDESNLAAKSLFSVGNHDGATPDGTQYDQKEHSAAWDGMGKDWVYENYIEPYISSLGYVMPIGHNDPSSTYYHSCFWHKDYTSQKIRLISLDCVHRFDGTVNPNTGAIENVGLKYLTNEQELWLLERLNETLNPENSAYGYSVVVACHYPLDDFDGDNEQWDDNTHRFVFNHNINGGRVMSHKTSSCVNFHLEDTTSVALDRRFCMRNRVDSGYTQSRPYPNYTKGEGNNMGSIISSWMTRGGKFVAWLCGHVHRDYMYYSKLFPEILIIAVDQAGCLRGTDTGFRDVNGLSGVACNITSIDTQNGFIKLLRFGYDMNKYLNRHQYMCYDYINKVVLNEG